jgi:hypothetical protein
MTGMNRFALLNVSTWVQFVPLNCSRAHHTMALGLELFCSPLLLDMLSEKERLQLYPNRLSWEAEQSVTPLRTT